MSPSYHVSVQVDLTVSAPDHEAAEDSARTQVEDALGRVWPRVQVDDVRAYGAGEAIV